MMNHAQIFEQNAPKGGKHKQRRLQGFSICLHDTQLPQKSHQSVRRDRRRAGQIISIKKNSTMEMISTAIIAQDNMATGSRMITNRTKDIQKFVPKDAGLGHEITL
jgi:hypothetical protein